MSEFTNEAEIELKAEQFVERLNKFLIKNGAVLTAKDFGLIGENIEILFTLKSISEPLIFTLAKAGASHEVYYDGTQGDETE